MLFAIDVGNTNITMGLFDGEKLEKTFRMTTGISRTSDEFGVFLGELLRMRNLPLDVIDEVIIASVVPNVMHSLTNGIRKYFKLDPLIVEPGVKTGINITIPNPRQLGADRIVDAVAAYHMYGGPCSSTSTTPTPRWSARLTSSSWPRRSACRDTVH